MTFAVHVYAQGCRPETPFAAQCANELPELEKQFDHPNDHIHAYMARADDKSYFDSRLYEGKPKAASNRPQARIISTHHRRVQPVIG